jgi:hypothetical protein
VATKAEAPYVASTVALKGSVIVVGLRGALAEKSTSV